MIAVQVCQVKTKAIQKEWKEEDEKRREGKRREIKRAGKGNESM
jgi:hypothetical protein